MANRRENPSKRGKLVFFLLLLIVFTTGYNIAALTTPPHSFLPIPTSTVIQVSETYWMSNTTVELNSSLTYGTPTNRSSSTVVGQSLTYGTPTNRSSSTFLAYQLVYYLSYGDFFHVNKTWISNPIAVGKVGANKTFTINVTVWSPYGLVDHMEINISNLTKYLYDGSLHETYDPYNLFDPVGYSLSTNGGWVYFNLELKPSWEAGGTYDVWVYAEDTSHGYANSSMYPSLFSVVNTTYLYSYSFNKTVFSPNEPARLTLTVAYNGSTVGAEGEIVWVDGTQLITNSSGVAYYDFVTPSVAGTYTLNITLAHGETYVINFTVSHVKLHPKKLPTEYIIIAILILIVLGLAILRVLKHSIEDIRNSRMRFVRRK